MKFLLREVPQDLWIRAKHIAVDQGISMRILIFRAIKMYADATPLMNYSQNGMTYDDSEAKKMAQAAMEVMKDKNQAPK